jgi:hypothetical protein
MGRVVSAQMVMFRPSPSVRLGRIWHVLDRRLNGFMLVAPFPCGFVQAEILSETASTGRDRLMHGDLAILERRVCRHCLGAVRRGM